MSRNFNWERAKKDIEDLKEKQMDLLSLAKLTKLKSMSLAENLSAHNGSVMGTLIHHDEAENKLQMELDHLNISLDCFIKELSRCNIAADYTNETVVTPQYEDDVVSTPLPIVEIFEKLGDDDSITHVKLNEKPFVWKQESLTDNSENNFILTDSKSNCQDSCARLSKELFIGKPELLKEKTEEKDGQLDELLRDMGVTESRDDVIEYTTETQAIKNSSNSSYREVIQEIYELETLAGQIQPIDNDSGRDPNAFDYDFEDPESDLSECESPDFDDELDLSILPGNSEASSRLRDEIIALRMRKTETLPAIDRGLQKRVHFDDTLQIKEVENISAELQKVEGKEKRVSKFKNLKLRKGRTALTQIQKDSGNEKWAELHTNQSSCVQDDDENVMYNVYERTNAASKDIQSCPLQEDTETFKDLKRGLSETRSEVAQETQYTLEEDHDNSYGSDMVASDGFDDVHNETDKLARAYHQGTFGKEIEIHGPVIEKLDDFSVLNRIIESMPTKNKQCPKGKREGEDYSAWSGSVESEPTNDLEFSDEDVLADEIIEREDTSWNSLDDTSDDILKTDDIEQFNMNKDISEQYNRLKMKLFPQNSIRSDLHDLTFGGQ